MFFAKKLFDNLRNKLKGLYDAHEIDAIAFKYFLVGFNIKKTDIVINKPINWENKHDQKYQSDVQKLSEGMPVQQVLKKTSIAGLLLKITPEVLIPRVETEELINLIIEKENLQQAHHILDIGTGSGVIAIALAKKFKQSKVIAWDIDEQVLDIARENANQNQVNVSFEKKDILNLNSNSKNNTKIIDIIVSNPPYIPLNEKASMHKNVVDYEPHIALFVPDNNPLVFYEKIVKFASKHLVFNGKMYFEVHSPLADKTCELLETYNFESQIMQDGFNRSRFIISINRNNQNL